MNSERTIVFRNKLSSKDHINGIKNLNLFLNLFMIYYKTIKIEDGWNAYLDTITFNDKTGTIFHYSRLSFIECFTIMPLFLVLHNSCYSLSWLLDKSKMTIFKALKKLMLKLRNKTKLIKFKGAIDDELYINAGLKGRNNSIRIKHEYVNHSKGEWIKGKCHINNCENKASILRTWLANSSWNM